MFWKSKQFWGTIVAVALLGYCVKDITLDELRILSQRVDYWYLLPALFCTFLFVVLRAMRWQLMVSQHKKIKAPRAIALYSAGQVLNIVMPMLTGQVGRLFLFARKEGLRKTFVFSTIILEVLFDATSLVIFLAFSSLAFGVKAEYRAAGVVIAVITVSLLILLYTVLHFQTKLEDIGRLRLRHRWPSMYVGLKKFMRSFTKGIRTLRSSQHFFGTVA
ncbi:MAG: flippase-like domain-containing protein, partial [candidate division Zixibacteria bacterium]|nr:flippase-like domain-containing protein [candidate division Zixibacteria bacterium]